MSYPYSLSIETAPTASGAGKHQYQTKLFYTADDVEAKRKGEIEADHLVRDGTPWVHIIVLDEPEGRSVAEIRRPWILDLH
jgi:hypothetical protein